MVYIKNCRQKAVSAYLGMRKRAIRAGRTRHRDRRGFVPQARTCSCLSSSAVSVGIALRSAGAAVGMSRHFCNRSCNWGQQTCCETHTMAELMAPGRQHAQCDDAPRSPITVHSA